MRRDSRLACAVAAALGLQATGVHAADGAADQPGASGGSIAEIVVTATRRSENLQDVPIAITAITGETLAQLNVQTFDDLVKYVPNVSTASKGPGINEIYMRGLSTTQGGAQGGGGINFFPRCLRSISTTSRRSCRAAIWTSVCGGSSSASRSSRGLREPCTQRRQARKRVPSATSPTSQRSIPPKEPPPRAIRRPLTAIRAPASRRISTFRCFPTPWHCGRYQYYRPWTGAASWCCQHSGNLRAVRHRHRDLLLFPCGGASEQRDGLEP